MRARVLIAVLLACLSGAWAFGGRNRLDYTLTPVLEAGALTAIQVDVAFRGQADGETKLVLPSIWGGEEELWRGVQNLEVIEGATLRDGAGPAERLLAHRPNARIHLRYRIIQDRPGEPVAGQGNPYRPLVQPTYFHLIGDAAFVLPDLPGDTPARFRIRALPRGWSFASDAQHANAHLSSVRDSVTVGGDYRIVPADRNRVRVAIRGAWTFTDGDFAREASAILAAQRTFWSAASAPYLITMTQVATPDPRSVSVGGTGRGDAFAFFASANAPAARITRVLAHEGLHTWIPDQIGAINEEEEASGYWFSEGFTDFYAIRVLVRDRSWTPAEFAEDLNRVLLAYATSPAREAPNARITADFWNDRAVRDLPYQRGFLLGLIWDQRLRAQSAGARDLDDIMFEMKRRAGHVPRANAPKAPELFPVVAHDLGLDVAEDMALLVRDGRRILLPGDLFAPCGAVVTRDIPLFARGFDAEATTANNNIVTGLAPATPAYAAGLRNGMRILERTSGVVGDAEQEFVYRVMDGETERFIRFYPRGPGAVTLQSLELAPDAGEACVARLAGE